MIIKGDFSLKAKGERRRVRGRWFRRGGFKRPPLVLVVAIVVGAAAGWYGFGHRGGDVQAPDVMVDYSHEDYSFAECGPGNQHHCVIDGDTLRLYGDRIRIADFNTPEVFSPKCRREAELGAQATRKLIEILNAGPFVVEAYGGRDLDVYGRKLRILTRGGVSIADQMVDAGLAHRWRGYKKSWC